MSVVLASRASVNCVEFWRTVTAFCMNDERTFITVCSLRKDWRWLADDRRRTCRDVIRRLRAVARRALSASRVYYCRRSTSNCVAADDAVITTLLPVSTAAHVAVAGRLTPSQMIPAVVRIHYRRLSVTVAFHSRTYTEGDIGVKQM